MSIKLKVLKEYKVRRLVCVKNYCQTNKFKIWCKFKVLNKTLLIMSLQIIILKILEKNLKSTIKYQH
jgi:hypothetical protein